MEPSLCRVGRGTPPVTVEEVSEMGVCSYCNVVVISVVMCQGEILKASVYSLY